MKKLILSLIALTGFVGLTETAQVSLERFKLAPGQLSFAQKVAKNTKPAEIQAAIRHHDDVLKKDPKNERISREREAFLAAYELSTGKPPAF